MRAYLWVLALIVGCDGGESAEPAADAAADAGECVVGTEACACDAEARCEAGLVCDEDVCRLPLTCDEVACLPAQICMALEDQDATCVSRCMPGFTWNPGQMRCEMPTGSSCDAAAPGSIAQVCAAAQRACLEGPEGAACGACLPQHTDEAGALDACRPLLVCGDLRCADENRTCERPPGEDAACGACLPGFEGEDCRPAAVCTAALTEQCAAEGRMCEAGRCGACLSDRVETEGRCVEPAMCDGARCAALGRSCEAGACGPCLGGTLPVDPADPLSPCLVPEACTPDQCPDGFFCVEVAGQAPRCDPRPCGEGEALRNDVDVNGDPIASRCVPCEIECGADGETGALWPITLDNSDECVCETRPGFFFNDSENRAEVCDRDGDGWIRLESLGAVTSRYPALRANARCDVRAIDRMVLTNEFQQSKPVYLCLGGPQSTPCPEGLGVLILAESSTTDDARLIGPQDPAIAANGRGRRLRAEEANSLTKVCVAGADYNRDGIEDANDHPFAVPPDLAPELRGFVRFAHFIELHTGRFHPPAFTEQACDGRAPCPSDQVCAANGRCQARFGQYEIREKSRCDADFPLSYLDVDGDGWRQCTRNRDAAWSADASDPVPLVPVGFDFAEWSCDRLSGTCPAPPPPTGAEADAEIPPHGLCEVALPPADGVWRGMSHHSQFKCVTALGPDALVDRRARPQALPAAELVAEYRINACHIACPADDHICAADCQGDRCVTSSVPAGDGVGPRLVCSAEEAELAPGDVRWAAARYVSSDGYVRGCQSEWAPGGPEPAAEEAWRRLCPGYVDNPNGAAGDDNPAAFGRLLCGCGLGYGGERCEIGCPGALVGGPGDPSVCPFGYCVTGTAEAPGRLGFWLCGGFSGVVAPVAPPAAFELRRGRFDGIAHDMLCERREDCEDGWRVR